MPFDLPTPAKLWLPPKPAIIRAWKLEDLKIGFIPGFLPPGAAAAKAALTTLTQVAPAPAKLQMAQSQAQRPLRLAICWSSGVAPLPQRQLPLAPPLEPLYPTRHH